MMSAFGIEHGETFAKSARSQLLSSAWGTGKASRSASLRAIATTDKAAHSATRSADKSYLKAVPLDAKAAFLASKYRGTLATAGVGAAGGAAIETKRRKKQ